MIVVSLLRWRAALCILAALLASVVAVVAQPPAQSTPAATPRSVRLPTVNMNSNNKDVFLNALPPDFKFPENVAGRVLLREYGAVFVAGGGAVAPRKVIFRDESEVTAFQESVESSTEIIGGMSMTLQVPAMSALQAAINDAAAQRLSITPRDTDAASRSYFESVSLWLSRVEPGLQHWIAKKRISPQDATRIRSMPTEEQVAEILRLEKMGIYFAKDLSKSILYSVAPPGTSQHLSMLAFDVKEYEDSRVRAIMVKHGWHQTVISDLPHFTFLGLPEEQLPSRGLRMVVSGGRKFWVPNLPPDESPITTGG